MKTKQKSNSKLLTLISLMTLMALMTTGNLQAQVRIGYLSDPAKGALLDLCNDGGGYIGGLKLPHIQITNLGVIPTGTGGISETLTAGEILALKGMVVYNTTAVTGIPAGIYYWNGRKWVLVTLSSGEESFERPW